MLYSCTRVATAGVKGLENRKVHKTPRQRRKTPTRYFVPRRCHQSWLCSLRRVNILHGSRCPRLVTWRVLTSDVSVLTTWVTVGHWRRPVSGALTRCHVISAALCSRQHRRTRISYLTKNKSSSVNAIHNIEISQSASRKARKWRSCST